MQLRCISRRMVTAVVVTMVALAIPLWAAPSMASGETVPLPGNAAGSQAYGLVAGACPSAGSCVAGGFYTDAGLEHQGLLLSETNGSWSASELTFAAGQGSTTASAPQVTSVACASAGNCVAAGYYFGAMSAQEGFLVSESGGTWGKAIDATGTSPTHLFAAPQLVPQVSCVPNGTCYAIFNTFTGSAYENLVYAGSGGNWTATSVPTPAGGSEVELSSISCPPGGPCSIVGSYYDAASDLEGLLTATGSPTVTTIDTSALPNVAGNPVVTPQAVSCAASGDCTAVGYYQDASGGYQGLVVSSTGGTWGPAGQAQLPGNANTQGLDLSLNDVACASGGNCEVVGTYDSSPTDTIDGLLLSQSGGQWGTASEIGLPGTASSSQPGVYATAIVCPVAGACLAAGVYQDASDNTQGALLSQSAGSWTPTALAFPGGADDPSDNSDITSLACAPSDYCVLAGGYHEGSSGAAVLLAPPGATGTPTATAGVDHASVTWAAPDDNGGLPVTAYRIVANDLTAASRGGQVVNLGTSNAAVTLPTLTVGDSYTFSIAAINKLGVGLSESSNAVAILPSASQLSAALATLLAPSGAAARLRAVRRTAAYTFKFKSLEAGQVTLRWYGHYTTGRGRHTRQHRAMVAKVTEQIPVGLIKIVVRLTTGGRRLLRTARRLQVRGELTFTGAGQKPVKKTHTFTLH